MRILLLGLAIFVWMTSSVVAQQKCDLRSHLIDLVTVVAIDAPRGAESHFQGDLSVATAGRVFALKPDRLPGKWAGTIPLSSEWRIHGGPAGILPSCKDRIFENYPPISFGAPFLGLGPSSGFYSSEERRCDGSRVDASLTKRGSMVLVVIQRENTVYDHYYGPAESQPRQLKCSTKSDVLVRYRYFETSLEIIRNPN